MPLDLPVVEGGTLPGVLTSCHPAVAGATQVAVMLHGLFTDMNHNFAAELAEAIAIGTGLAAFRFSFRQHTDPAFVFPGYADDLLRVRCVVDALASRGLRTACVIGHSKGANVAIMFAAQAPERVPIAALAPRFFMAGMPSSLFSPAELAGLREGGPGAVLTWAPKVGGEVRITQRMLDDVCAIEMGDVVASIPPGVPVLLVHGRKDQTIPVSDADAFVAVRPSIEKHVLKTGHVFSDERSKMIRLVVDWVTRHCPAADRVDDASLSGPAEKDERPSTGAASGTQAGSVRASGIASATLAGSGCGSSALASPLPGPLAAALAACDSDTPLAGASGLPAAAQAIETPLPASGVAGDS